MARTTPDNAEQEPAEQDQGRPWWELGEADRRLLYITIVGGLVANVGLVVIVGLGLLEAHLIHRYRHPVASFAGDTVRALAIFAGTTLALAFARFIRKRVRRRTLDKNSPPAKTSRRSLSAWKLLTLENIQVGLGLIILASLILALVGYAAGIN